MRTRHILPEVKQRKQSKYEHLVGQILGTREVVGSLPRSLFSVRCTVCGHETVQRGVDLAKMKTRACIKCIIDNRDANAKTVFNRVKRNAKTRSISFDLSLEQFIEIASKNCFYCNAEPMQAYGFRERSRPYNGLDRVDNSIGYTKKNAVSCCPNCNYAKHDMDIKSFKQWLTKCYSHLILNGEDNGE